MNLECAQRITVRNMEEGEKHNDSSSLIDVPTKSSRTPPPRAYHAETEAEESLPTVKRETTFFP